MKSIILLIFAFAFLCCSNTSPVAHEMQNDEEQGYVDSIVDSTLLFLYFKAKDYPDSTFADSAISLADSMLYVYKENEFKHLTYAFQKVLFLTMTKQMDSAIDLFYVRDDYFVDFINKIRFYEYVFFQDRSLMLLHIANTIIEGLP